MSLSPPQTPHDGRRGGKRATNRLSSDTAWGGGVPKYIPAYLLQNILYTNLTEMFSDLCVALGLFKSARFSCFCGKKFQCYEENEEFEPL
jgi:hypothetical protein